MYGKEIKNAKIALGVTQSKVAKDKGLPQNTISRIEPDKEMPNVLQCLILADYYGLS